MFGQQCELLIILGLLQRYQPHTRSLSPLGDGPGGTGPRLRKKKKVDILDMYHTDKVV